MKGQNAYFTVEAALVLPLVMSAMLFGIYLFCFQYDRCLLEQDLGGLLLWGSGTVTENAGNANEQSAQLSLRAAEVYRDKYVAWEFTAMDIHLKQNELSVSGQGRLAFPVPGWNLWNDSNIWGAESSFSGNRLSPVFYIRQYRKLQDMVNEEKVEN